MHDYPRRRTLHAVATALTVVTFTACSNDMDRSMPGMDHGGTPTTSATAAATDPARAGDIMFAQMMIPHHEQAIEMADLALDKPSASADVRRLASEVKAAQDPEIETMRTWLDEWGAPVSAPGDVDHGPGMMNEAEMSALGSAEGAEFDRMWLTMMIAHHRGAVTMAEQVLTTTQDPEVRRLAEAIIETQNREIVTMQGLL